eukprot:719632-Amphidinium_carterae.1
MSDVVLFREARNLDASGGGKSFPATSDTFEGRFGAELLSTSIASKGELKVWALLLLSRKEPFNIG